jgi:acetyltransferase-like isoleucine patch superfamily enzyme
MGKLAALLLMFMPSIIKVSILRVLGHEVHSTAYIGFSFIHIKNIKMGKDSYIGFLNIFTHLNSLEMEEGSRINRWNRFASGPEFDGKLRLRRHASISLRHYFDVCDLVEIGENTIVAGHRSTFFTHSKGVEIIDYVKPIIVGKYCYLGSNLCAVPGTRVGDFCFVGMGSVLVGDMSKYSYSLLGGNPAKVRKEFPKNSAYFIQGDIVHPHLK